MAKQKKKESYVFPVWAAVAFGGALAAFIGFFLNVFHVAFDVDPGSGSSLVHFEQTLSGLDLITAVSLPVPQLTYTIFKFIPLVIAIVAVIIMVYAAIFMISPKTLSKHEHVSGVTFVIAGVFVFLVVVLFLAIYGGLMFNHYSFMSLDNVLNDVMEAGMGAWLFVAGAVAILVSPFLHMKNL